MADLSMGHLATCRQRDASWIIERQFEGHCHQWTNARHRHQPPTDRVFTDNRKHSLVQFCVLRLQSRACRKHRPGDTLQYRLARHQFSNPNLKIRACHSANLQSEAAQDLECSNVHQSSEKLLVCNQ
jgi:hypothetical protein